MLRKLFTLFFCLSATIIVSFAQNSNATYSYSAKDKNIKEILNDIERISNYRFSYNSNIIKATEKKTLSFQNKTIKAILPLILGNGYTYTIIGSQIIITEKEDNNNQQKKKTTEQIKAKTTSKTAVIPQDTIHITVYDTVYNYVTVADTIRVIDTIQKINTTTVHRYETNILHINDNALLFDIHTGCNMTIPHFQGKDDYAKQLRDMQKSSIGYGLSGHVSYKMKDFLFTSGLEYASLRTENSYTTTDIIQESNTSYTDTVYYWEYQELFTYYKFSENGDSVAVTVMDSIYTYKVFEHPQQVTQKTDKTTAAIMDYISIPFGFGLHYTITNTLSIRPTVYAQFNIRTRCRGEIADETMNNTISLKDILRPYTISTKISCALLYSPQRNYSIAARPSVSFIPGIMKKDVFSHQCFLINPEFTFGIVYTIPYE